MRDENNRFTVPFELPDDVEQFVGLLGSKHCRGFVQDQDLGVPHQGLDDLHPLLDSHREVFHHGVGVDVEAVLVRDLADPAAGRFHVQESGGLSSLIAQGNVLGDAEDRNQHKVLMHHADSGGHRFAGVLERHRFAVDQDFALGGVVEAVENVHQGGFPCAVLPQETMHLSRLNHEVDVVIGYQGSETLRDPP